MGLYDRDYMNPQGTDGGDGRRMLWGLIILNVIVYFTRLESLALIVTKEFSTVNLLQLLTAGFYHKSFFNLFFNMWGLYIFGTLVAPRTSGLGMLFIYLAGSISGNLLFLLTASGAVTPFFGAVGAVCAMMTAAAMLEPERKFMLIIMPFAPIKITTLVICYTLFDILSGLSSGMMYLSHMAGFIGGYLMMKLIFGRNVAWDPLRLNKKSSNSGSFSRSRPTPKPSTPPKSAASGSADSPVSQKELDALLDKLSTGGINSLSEYELERLRKARRQMRGEE